MMSAVAAMGMFDGGKQCDAAKFIAASWSTNNEEDYKLSKNSCQKSCKDKYPGDEAEQDVFYCCEYAEIKDGSVFCTLAQMTDSDSLETQEYAQGNEKNDWYWAFMVNDMYEGDDMWMGMGNGANTLALAASSVILIASAL